MWFINGVVKLKSDWKSLCGNWSGMSLELNDKFMCKHQRKLIACGLLFFLSFFICSINETIQTYSFSYLQIAGLMRFFQVHWFIFCIAQKHCVQLLNCQMLMNECKTMNKCTIFVVLLFNACGTRKKNDARRQQKRTTNVFIEVSI